MKTKCWCWCNREKTTRAPMANADRYVAMGVDIMRPILQDHNATHRVLRTCEGSMPGPKETLCPPRQKKRLWSNSLRHARSAIYLTSLPRMWYYDKGRRWQEKNFREQKETPTPRQNTQLPSRSLSSSPSKRTISKSRLGSELKAPKVGHSSFRTNEKTG